MADFTCRNVWERAKPVLLAVHNHDGDWQMLCDGEEHINYDEIVIIHKEHLVDRDPSLASILDLPNGWEANRDTDSAEWNRAAILAEE